MGLILRILSISLNTNSSVKDRPLPHPVSLHVITEEDRPFLPRQRTHWCHPVSFGKSHPPAGELHSTTTTPVSVEGGVGRTTPVPSQTTTTGVCVVRGWSATGEDHVWRDGRGEGRELETEEVGTRECGRRRRGPYGPTGVLDRRRTGRPPPTTAHRRRRGVPVSSLLRTTGVKNTKI